MKQAGPRDWSPPENNNYRPADSYRYPSNQSTTTFAPRKLVRNWPGRLSLLLGITAAGLALFPIASAGAGNGYIASTVGITAIGYGFYALSALVSFFFVQKMVRETRGQELEAMVG